MRLKQLQIRNFKSIREADILFPPMTLVVGANAAGKSNLVSVFRFLSDLLTQGLETAVSLQGGIKWMANANLPKGTPIEFGFSLDITEQGQPRRLETGRPDELGHLRILCESIQFSLCLKPNKRGEGYRVQTDKMEFSVWCADPWDPDEETRGQSIPEAGIITFSLSRNKLGAYSLSHRFTAAGKDSTAIEKEGKRLRELVFSRFQRGFTDLSGKTCLFHRFPGILGSFPDFSLESLFRIYDFSSKALKQPSPAATVPYLKEDGSNIAAVLRTILRDKEKNRKLNAIVKDYLPFAEGTTVRDNFDKSLSLAVLETYSGKQVPQDFLSDGTVSVLAILIALYFQEQHILILEEPERNLHPRLLLNLLLSMEDVSTLKQVIVTSQNQELLKHAKLESVLLASRDREGFTTFSFPKDSQTVRTFLENDLGLDDLFLQDMMGV